MKISFDLKKDVLFISYENKNKQTNKQTKKTRQKKKDRKTSAATYPTDILI